VLGDPYVSIAFLNIDQYDPRYKEKIKSIVEKIDEKFAERKQFTVPELNRHLEFDAAGHCRMLARRGYLVGSRGEFERALWPPPAALLEGEPIGLTHCVQTWFHYYLQQWITDSMSQLETREGVYSLDYRGGGNGNPAVDPSDSSRLTRRRGRGHRRARGKKIALRRRPKTWEVVGGRLR
jgi:hypothetical protein